MSYAKNAERRAREREAKAADVRQVLATAFERLAPYEKAFRAAILEYMREGDGKELFGDVSLIERPVYSPGETNGYGVELQREMKDRHPYLTFLIGAGDRRENANDGNDGFFACMAMNPEGGADVKMIFAEGDEFDPAYRRVDLHASSPEELADRIQNEFEIHAENSDRLANSRSPNR